MLIMIQKDGPPTFTQLKAKMKLASPGPTLQLLKLTQTQCSQPNAFNSASLTISPPKPPKPLYLSLPPPTLPQIFTKLPELSLLSKLMQLIKKRYKRNMELHWTLSMPSTQSLVP